MQHVISVSVENKFGVLARIASLFCGRGYNIDSLTVSPTNEDGISMMTIATTGDDAVIEQIEKQLTKIIDVIAVSDLTGKDFIERELLLIKVKTDAANRSEIMQITEIFKGKIVNVHENELTVELSGRGEKINAFVKLMNAFGIIELARTGKVAIGRKPGPSHYIDEI